MFGYLFRDASCLTIQLKMTSFFNYKDVGNQVHGNLFVHGDNIVHMVKDPDEQCLRDLKSTDPRDDKTRIEGTKDKLLKESFVWILDDAGFKDWRDKDDIQLLWIKGDPGKGKTMLMIGLIEELSNQLELEPESGILSYFFCQGIEARLKTAVFVLRGLIYLLAIQNRNLIRHIRKRYDNVWVPANDLGSAKEYLGDSHSKYLSKPLPEHMHRENRRCCGKTKK